MMGDDKFSGVSTDGLASSGSFSNFLLGVTALFLRVILSVGLTVEPATGNS